MKLKTGSYYQLDEIDAYILKKLTDDSRIPLTEIAEALNLSTGTIHVRYEKLKQAGIITGSTLKLDYDSLGYSVSAFVGVNLEHPGQNKLVVERFKKINEILEAYLATGPYDIFIKIRVQNLTKLHELLLQIQSIGHIQSTQTIVVLQNPFVRNLVPEAQV